MSLSKLQSHLYVRWIFLRILSLCFLAAFASIYFQILGLYGKHGVLPIKTFLDFMSLRLGDNAFLNFPSIFWFSAEDGVLQAVCLLACILSSLSLLGIFTGPLLAIQWFLYLSLVSVGQDFMGFQWDSLMLETALLAVFFAPWGARELHPFIHDKFEAQNEPSYFFLFFLRFLCFKLMFFSGICKLSSHEPAWRDLTALTYHYETQPLPMPAAWIAHKLPCFFQSFSTLLVLAAEIILPLFLLTPFRRLRISAASGFILLMLAIIVTGNYAFFNWLTIALSLTLLDDRALFCFLPRSLRRSGIPRTCRWNIIFRNTFLSLFAATVIGVAVVSSFWMGLDGYLGIETEPQFFQMSAILSRPLCSFNSYGLFAVMTKVRKEIIIEGSNDGVHWIPYEFKYKPGDLRRGLPVIAPFQPRLDWQLWFAALGSAEDSPWFESLLKRLLQGAPELLGLLESNPFPEGPPRQVRAMLYEYRFSDLEALFRRGEWWYRSARGVYFPACSLQDFEVMPD